MALIPAFEIGIWNAWIIILLSFLSCPVSIFLINKEAMKKFTATPSVPYSKTEKISDRIYLLLALATIVYSIFLPLKLGTVWLYIGLPLCFIALIMNLITAVSFATAPLVGLVTKWTYRISRNPICVGTFLMYVGISIACASWIYLTYAVVFIILMRIGVTPEERFLLEKHGNAYREYMNRTPRWIGIPRANVEN
jgi:protein-S-isoprenylcysteine O-methyltransferase Ste14